MDAKLIEAAYSSGLVPRNYQLSPLVELVPAAWSSRAASGFIGTESGAFPRGGLAGSAFTSEVNAGKDFYLCLHGSVLSFASLPTTLTYTYPAIKSQAQAYLIRHGLTDMGIAGTQLVTAGAVTAVGNELYLGRNANEIGGRWLFFVPAGTSVSYTTAAGVPLRTDGLYILGKVSGSLQTAGAFSLIRWDGNFRFGSPSWGQSNIRQVVYVYCQPYQNAELNGVIASNMAVPTNEYLLFSSFLPLLPSTSSALAAYYFSGYQFSGFASQSFTSSFLNVVAI